MVATRGLLVIISYNVIITFFVREDGVLKMRRQQYVSSKLCTHNMLKLQ